MEDTNVINEEWYELYDMLEAIRKSGVCNMFGASPVLAMMSGISESNASKVLVNWMHNYDELSKVRNW